MRRSYILPVNPTKPYMTIQKYEKKWSSKERNINNLTSVCRDLLDLEEECLIQGNTDLLMHLLQSERRKKFHIHRPKDFIHAETVSARLGALVLSPLYDDEDIQTILETWSEVPMLLRTLNMSWADSDVAFKYEDESELCSIVAINTLVLIGVARPSDSVIRDNLFVVGIQSDELESPIESADKRLTTLIRSEQCLKVDW